MIRAIIATLFSVLLAQGASAQSSGADDVGRRAVQRRAVEAAVWGIPAVNYDLMLQEAHKLGVKDNEIVYWGRDRSTGTIRRSRPIPTPST